MTALAWPQAGGQFLPSWMLAFLWLFLRRWQRLALRLDFGVAHSRLQLQQLKLRIAEFLAAGSVLLDPFQAQPFFQYLDLQFGPGKFLLQLDDLFGFG